MLKKSTIEEGREKEDLGGYFTIPIQRANSHIRFLVDAKSITIETRMADGIYPVFPSCLLVGQKAPKEVFHWCRSHFC